MNMKTPDKSLDRFTVCLEKGLLARLDEISAERGYPSRSQAMADFIRRAVTKKEWRGGRACAGTISVYYKAGKNSPSPLVEEILTANTACIAAIQTAILGNGNVLLTASVTGKPDRLEKLADSLRALKGVTHGSFSVIAPV